MLGKDTEKKNERHHLSVMALIFSSSSRRCGNVCKRSKGRRCGKQCLRAVGKLTAFPSGRKYLFSIGGAAVFHISIVLFWNIGSPSCYEQSIDGQGNIPGRYYFLSGFTAKLAGTERGITEPTPTFSACFGQAFLELHRSEEHTSELQSH